MGMTSLLLQPPGILHTPAFLPVSPFVAQHPGRGIIKKVSEQRGGCCIKQREAVGVIPPGSACSLHCPCGCAVCKKKAPLTAHLAAPDYQ